MSVSATRKRILLLAYEFPPLGGGVATAVKHLLEELAQHKNLEIDLITSSLRNTLEVEKISANCGIYKVPIGPKSAERYQRQSLLEMGRFICNASKQAKQLQELRKYDLVHSFGYPGPWTAYYLWRRYSLPYLVSLRGVDVPFYNPRFALLDWLARPVVSCLWGQARAVIANSRGLRDLAMRTNDKLDYQIISNGVDTKFFQSQSEGTKFKKFTVTAGGTIMGRKKGLNYLIEGFAEFAEGKKDVELLLIGEGDLREELQTQVATLQIKDKVKFVGRKDKTWLGENLGKCHAFCLPSLSEGMSNATLEAMACGLPIILTPVGGSQELLGSNGFLVPQADPAEIASSLELLYADKQLRISMGQESRKRAEKMSWQKVAKEYEEIYEKH